MSASEETIEKCRELNRINNRFDEIEEYLENTERRTFTAYEVSKMVVHIREGGGWL